MRSPWYQVTCISEDTEWIWIERSIIACNSLPWPYASQSTCGIVVWCSKCYFVKRNVSPANVAWRLFSCSKTTSCSPEKTNENHGTTASVRTLQLISSNGAFHNCLGGSHIVNLNRYLHNISIVTEPCLRSIKQVLNAPPVSPPCGSEDDIDGGNV